jgi:hypothetical protein
MTKATKKATKKAKADATTKRSRTVADTEPKFPYTTKPASLRRLLKEIPQKPKPPKFDMTLLKSWGFNDQNDHSMLRVLKSVNLLDSKNEPTELYTQFMNLEGGARALGPEIKRVYAPLFQASHTPYSESNDRLQNLFNIHSGGGNRALDQQIQTFKALCENAIFDGAVNDPLSAGASAAIPALSSAVNQASANVSSAPAININLHIHLPENKTRRDYEDIIESIGRYIFGRSANERRD